MCTGSPRKISQPCTHVSILELLTRQLQVTDIVAMWHEKGTKEIECDIYIIIKQLILKTWGNPCSYQSFANGSFNKYLWTNYLL